MNYTWRQITASNVTRAAALKREYLIEETIQEEGGSALALAGGHTRRSVSPCGNWGTTTAADSEHARCGRREGAPGSERLPEARLPVGGDCDAVPLQAGVELEPGEPEELGREGLVAVRPLERIEDGRAFQLLEGPGRLALPRVFQ